MAEFYTDTKGEIRFRVAFMFLSTLVVSVVLIAWIVLSLRSHDPTDSFRSEQNSERINTAQSGSENGVVPPTSFSSSMEEGPETTGELSQEDMTSTQEVVEKPAVEKPSAKSTSTSQSKSNFQLPSFSDERDTDTDTDTDADADADNGNDEEQLVLNNIQSSETSPSQSTERAVAATSVTSAPVVVDKTVTVADPRPQFFETVAPNAALPPSSTCAGLVKPAAENVTENAPFNQTKGRSIVGKTYLKADNVAIDSAGYEERIDGDYIGTTDEILQWGACKWGFDEDLVRALAYGESSWYAGGLGDCNEAETPTRTRDCASFGILQIKGAELTDPTHPGLYPIGLDSTAMNVDYSLAILRLCYDGKELWLGEGDPAVPYKAGDLWGCVGRWKSGEWHDTGEWGSTWYVGYVKDILAGRDWESPYVGAGERPLTSHPKD